MKTYKGISGKLLGNFFSRSILTRSGQLLAHRSAVLVLTFALYATFRLSRRPLSIVKSVFHDEKCLVNSTISNFHNNSTEPCGWAPFDGKDGKKLLGLLDSCFLFVYIFGMYANGYIVERTNARHVLSISMIGCGLICIAFGFAKSFEIHSLWYFAVLQALSGFTQAGVPTLVATVGQWFENTKKGLIFGIWMWHTSVGNVVGSVIAGAFSETNWGLSFIVPGIICLVMSVITFFFLIPKPSHVGLQDSESQIDLENDTNQIVSHQDAKFPNNSISKEENRENVRQEGNGKAISVLQALMIPGVIEFSICQFFTKLVSFTFLYWLPFYLASTTNLSSSHSAFATIIFDIGGCLGSLTAGLMADRTGASGLTCMVFLVLSIPSLYSYYQFSSASLLLNQCLQFVAGFFINGPYTLILATVSANLACSVPSKSAMATVSAIINGTGSIGAAIGPMFAAMVSEHGWSYVFYMAMLADVLATVSLLRIGYRDVMRLVKGNAIDIIK